MRPKPLIPTRTGMLEPSFGRIKVGPGRSRPRRAAETLPGRPRSVRWGASDVAVLDGHRVEARAAVERGEVLGDRHRAVPAAGAPDRDHEVGLALGDVL